MISDYEGFKKLFDARQIIYRANTVIGEKQNGDTVQRSGASWSKGTLSLSWSCSFLRNLSGSQISFAIIPKSKGNAAD